MLSLALVGVSGYGRTHLEIIRRVAARGLGRLAAAVVINPAEEAAACATLRAEGCRVYSSFPDMIAAEAGRLDLVLLPVPIHLHADLACAALAAGAHVLVEKPLAAAESEIDRIETAARRHRRRVFVGFQDLYADEIHALKAAVLAGAIGRLRSIRGLGCWPRPAAYYARNAWAGRLAVGGRPVLDSPLNNAFAHFIMLTLFLAGERPAAVGEWHEGEAELLRAQPIESFDTAALRLRFASGVESLWLCTHSAREPREPFLRLEGDAGHATWRFGEAATLHPAAGHARRWPSLPLLDHRAHMLLAIVRSLHGEPGVFTCDPALARAHTRLIVALHAQVPIHVVPPVHLAAEGEGAERQLRIAGVETVLDRALATGRMPSELGAPWAPAASPLSPSTPALVAPVA